MPSTSGSCSGPAWSPPTSWGRRRGRQSQESSHTHAGWALWGEAGPAAAKLGGPPAACSSSNRVQSNWQRKLRRKRREKRMKCERNFEKERTKERRKEKEKRPNLSCQAHQGGHSQPGTSKSPQQDHWTFQEPWRHTETGHQRRGIFQAKFLRIEEEQKPTKQDWIEIDFTHDSNHESHWFKCLQHYHEFNHQSKQRPGSSKTKTKTKETDLECQVSVWFPSSSAPGSPWTSNSSAISSCPCFLAASTAVNSIFTSFAFEFTSPRSR